MDAVAGAAAEVKIGLGVESYRTAAAINNETSVASAKSEPQTGGRSGISQFATP